MSKVQNARERSNAFLKSFHETNRTLNDALINRNLPYKFHRKKSEIDKHSKRRNIPSQPTLVPMGTDFDSNEIRSWKSEQKSGFHPTESRETDESPRAGLQVKKIDAPRNFAWENDATSGPRKKTQPNKKLPVFDEDDLVHVSPEELPIAGNPSLLRAPTPTQFAWDRLNSSSSLSNYQSTTASSFSRPDSRSTKKKQTKKSNKQPHEKEEFIYSNDEGVHDSEDETDLDLEGDTQRKHERNDEKHFPSHHDRVAGASSKELWAIRPQFPAHPHYESKVDMLKNPSMGLEGLSRSSSSETKGQFHPALITPETLVSARGTPSFLPNDSSGMRSSLIDDTDPLASSPSEWTTEKKDSLKVWKLGKPATRFGHRDNLNMVSGVCFTVPTSSSSSLHPSNDEPETYAYPSNLHKFNSSSSSLSYSKSSAPKNSSATNQRKEEEEEEDDDDEDHFNEEKGDSKRNNTQRKKENNNNNKNSLVNGVLRSRHQQSDLSDDDDNKYDDDDDIDVHSQLSSSIAPSVGSSHSSSAASSFYDSLNPNKQTFHPQLSSSSHKSFDSSSHHRSNNDKNNNNNNNNNYKTNTRHQSIEEGEEEDNMNDVDDDGNEDRHFDAHSPSETKIPFQSEKMNNNNNNQFHTRSDSSLSNSSYSSSYLEPSESINLNNQTKSCFLNFSPSPPVKYGRKHYHSSTLPSSQQTTLTTTTAASISSSSSPPRPNSAQQDDEDGSRTIDLSTQRERLKEHSKEVPGSRYWFYPTNEEEQFKKYQSQDQDRLNRSLKSSAFHESTNKNEHSSHHRHHQDGSESLSSSHDLPHHSTHHSYSQSLSRPQTASTISTLGFLQDSPSHVNHTRSTTASQRPTSAPSAARSSSLSRLNHHHTQDDLHLSHPSSSLHSPKARSEPHLLPTRKPQHPRENIATLQNKHPNHQQQTQRQLRHQKWQFASPMFQSSTPSQRFMTETRSHFAWPQPSSSEFRSSVGLFSKKKKNLSKFNHKNKDHPSQSDVHEREEDKESMINLGKSYQDSEFLSGIERGIIARKGTGVSECLIPSDDQRNEKENQGNHHHNSSFISGSHLNNNNNKNNKKSSFCFESESQSQFIDYSTLFDQKKKENNKNKMTTNISNSQQQHHQQNENQNNMEKIDQERRKSKYEEEHALDFSEHQEAPSPPLSPSRSRYSRNNEQELQFQQVAKTIGRPPSPYYYNSVLRRGGK